MDDWQVIKDTKNMSEKRTEASIKVNENLYAVSGFLKITMQASQLTWVFIIDKPSSAMRKLAFENKVALVDCCDGSGEGIFIMVEADAIHIHGSGPWIAK